MPSIRSDQASPGIFIAFPPNPRFNERDLMPPEQSTYDVTAIGETLVDFTPDPTSRLQPPVFQANPGGAPCNVLAMLARLGRRTGFIGKVGDDIFGRLLRARILEAGIDDTGLVSGGEACTTLAFVHISETGDRDFSFFRNPGADMMLRWEEIPPTLLRQTRIFHFGTISMTHQDIRNVTKKAVACARGAGALLSFDPNIRLPLWENLASMRRQIVYGCGQCDILKIEANELQLLTGQTDWERAADALHRSFPNIRLALITAGARGSGASTGSLRSWQPTFRNVDTIDTTGAGDAFLGACLAFLLEHGPEGISTAGHLDRMLLFANAAASIVTTRRGALASMPTRGEINALIAAAH